MVFKSVVWLFLVGCSGPAFNAASLGESSFAGATDDSVVLAGAAGRATITGAGGSNGQLLSPSAGASGEPGDSISESGASGSGNVAMPIPPMWGCRTDESVCQCYADQSVFEPGWLPDHTCTTSNRCTLRDETACVCWADDVGYNSALTVKGTVAVKGCPNVQNHG